MDWEMIMLHGFVYALLLPIILCYSLLFILFFLCSLNKKRRTLINIGMYIKSGNLIFMLHFLHVQVSKHSGRPAKPGGLGKCPGTSAAYDKVSL